MNGLKNQVNLEDKLAALVERLQFQIKILREENRLLKECLRPFADIYQAGKVPVCAETELYLHAAHVLKGIESRNLKTR
jgi:hypothetical protein